MSPLVRTLLRVLILSTVISIAIKWGAPQLAIPANNFTATLGVFLPVVTIAMVLGWRQVQASRSEP